MTRLYAQPYDITACGFYFDDAESYARKAAELRNAYGEPVEKFEIQFIDGEPLDAALARAWGLSQCNFAHFFEAVLDWDEEQKLRFIIAVGGCGYSFEPESVDPYDFEIDLYFVDTLRDLAEEFVDEGLYGEIPQRLTCYIDYEAIARDLSVDFAMTEIDGRRLAYACR